ncbi:hypothetical protein, partial [Mycolicibacterium poriferae]|uniref:hypothetical protein n=1 Tax=Mycolicibacterium poriferae TaxID=39694 RepID=UPI0032193B25
DLPAAIKKKPSPIAVLLVSLFGYPGVGHLMVGARRLGVAIIVVFTALTVGVLYEIWALVTPILALYSEGVLLDRLCHGPVLTPESRKGEPYQARSRAA